MRTLLELRDITFSYGPQAIFDEVSFGVKEGERLAIIGRNGSGKTTFLRMAAGLLAPQQGTVFLDECALKKMRKRSIAQFVAFVPQQLLVCTKRGLRKPQLHTCFVRSCWHRLLA